MPPEPLQEDKGDRTHEIPSMLYPQVVCGTAAWSYAWPFAADGLCSDAAAKHNGREG